MLQIRFIFCFVHSAVNRLACFPVSTLIIEGQLPKLQMASVHIFHCYDLSKTKERHRSKIASLRKDLVQRNNISFANPCCNLDNIFAVLYCGHVRAKSGPAQRNPLAVPPPSALLMVVAMTELAGRDPDKAYSFYPLLEMAFL